ncbi:MAG: AbrB/MazE/SpoVT family DNA-binding domain-containing protein [Candidatus Nanoarchaeia archaeon]
MINMEFAIAKVSTKGQIVIPLQLREGIKTGDEFLIVKDNDRIILKSMKGLAAELKDDLKFAQKIDSAWKEYEQGKFTENSKSDFLEELKKW